MKERPRGQVGTVKMRELTENEIREELFQILCDFIDYCDGHGLRYCLCAGTMLGAARHKGFIPWDDDIDVYMPRPDFDRFHELFQTEPVGRQYKLIGINAGEGFWPFAKMINTRIAVENPYTTTDRNLWVDIFPMDGLPEDEKESERILAQSLPCRKKIDRCNAKIGAGKNKLRAILKIPMILFYKAVGAEHYGKKLDKLARGYDFESSEYIGEIVWSLGAKERMKKESFLPFSEVEFHGRLVNAPGEWDAYLRTLYGNYMELPPEEKRIRHGFLAYKKDEDEE